MWKLVFNINFIISKNEICFINFGSIQILRVNNVELAPSLLTLGIHSKNGEIISKIVENLNKLNWHFAPQKDQCRDR